MLYTHSTVILARHELVFLLSVPNCILFSVQSMMQLAVSFGFAMGPAIGGGLQEVRYKGFVSRFDSPCLSFDHGYTTQCLREAYCIQLETYNYPFNYCYICGTFFTNFLSYRQVGLYYPFLWLADVLLS